MSRNNPTEWSPTKIILFKLKAEYSIINI
jgi:hypothetical protein